MMFSWKQSMFMVCGVRTNFLYKHTYLYKHKVLVTWAAVYHVLPFRPSGQDSYSFALYWILIVIPTTNQTNYLWITTKMNLAKCQITWKFGQAFGIQGVLKYHGLFFSPKNYFPVSNPRNRAMVIPTQIYEINISLASLIFQCILMVHGLQNIQICCTKFFFVDSTSCFTQISENFVLVLSCHPILILVPHVPGFWILLTPESLSWTDVFQFFFWILQRVLCQKLASMLLHCSL